MKKLNKKKAILLLLTLMLAASLLIVYAFADAGSFSGSSDYGGGSSGWGSSDWGSSDYSYGGGYYSSGSSGDGIFSGLGIIVFIVIIIVFVAAKSSRKGVGTVGTAGAAPTNIASLYPIGSLKESDPFFSESAMKEKISNLYVQMQDAWQNKDFETMRPYMTDSLFNQFNRQLDELKNSQLTNYIDRIAVLDVMLNGWSSDGTNDSLVAILNTRIVDYTVSDKTGELVGGSKTAEKFMCYEWTLIRSKGMKTPPPSGEGSEETNSIHCPSCGAPVDINHSAKCPYCDSIISAKDYDWVISGVKGISQRTVG